jgi:hypothetical protein
MPKQRESELNKEDIKMHNYILKHGYTKYQRKIKIDQKIEEMKEHPSYIVLSILSGVLYKILLYILQISIRMPIVIVTILLPTIGGFIHINILRELCIVILSLISVTIVLTMCVAEHTANRWALYIGYITNIIYIIYIYHIIYIYTYTHTLLQLALFT